jgi:hypothetical protein
MMWAAANDPTGMILLLTVGALVLVVGLLFSWVVINLAKRASVFAQPRAPKWIDFRRAMAQVAATRSGRVLRGMRAELPRVVFHDGNSTVVVEVSRAEHPVRYYVGVRLVWPDGALRLEVLPRSLAMRLRKMLGMQRFSTGDARFDRDWAVLASDAEKGRTFLSPEVRQWLAALALPPEIGETYLRIAAGELLVRQEYIHQIAPHAAPPATSVHTADRKAIDDLIAASLAIYAIALREPLAGISFTDEVEIDPAAPNCLVCGEAIIGHEVTCQSCRTPHHRECWHYVGGCSLFGCGGKQHEAYYLPPA